MIKVHDRGLWASMHYAVLIATRVSSIMYEIKTRAVHAAPAQFNL